MPLNLPTMADVNAVPRAKQKFEMETRLAERTAEIRDEKAAEKAWRKAVIVRDGKVCRCCGRKVVPQLALAPERLEVHHIKGRAEQATRFDVRNGLTVCSECHEKLTHFKVVIVQAAKHLFRIGTTTYINAAKPLVFKVAA